MKDGRDSRDLGKWLLHQFAKALSEATGTIKLAAFQIIMMGLLFYVYCIPDQANDIFISLSHENTRVFTFFLMSLLLVSYFNWFIARHNFRLLYSCEVKSASEDEHAMRYLPRRFSLRFYRYFLIPFLTLSPFIIAAKGFSNSGSSSYATSVYIILLTGSLWCILLLYLQFSGKVTSMRVVLNQPWTEIRAFKGRTLALIILVIFLMLFAAMVFTPMRWGIARIYGPIVVMTLGFLFWYLLGSLLFLWSRILHFPILLALLLFQLLVAEPYNNNHAVRTLSLKNTPVQSAKERLNEWLSQFARFYEKDTTGKEIPLFIVSSEGGGVRSAYWTSRVLHTIDSLSDGAWHRHLAVMSGVSGGSVGNLFYLSSTNACLRNQEVDSLGKRIRQLASFDFLSDLNVGVVFTDMILKGVPYPINGLDRARKLEDAFSLSFQRSHHGQHDLEDGLAHAYARVNDQPVSPLLLFNCTHVESGKKIVVANARLDSLERPYFCDTEDALSILGADVPLKCAASMSARFPFVTPPALLQGADSSWGHVVDGGYFDNSGLQSAYQSYLMLQDLLLERGKTSTVYSRMRIHMVYIKNSFEQTGHQVATYADESAPVNAFFNAWGRKGVSERKVLQKVLPADRFHFIELKRAKKDGIPLGWYLSYRAIDMLEKQLRGSLPKSSGMLGILHALKK